MQYNRNHNHNLDRESIKHPILKIAGVGFLSALLCFGLGQVGSTVSYFVDIETSLGNIFKADPLDFAVNLATTTVDMGSGQETVVPTMVPGEDSEPVQYSVQSKMLDGDIGFCSSLTVLTTAPFPYDGPLLSLNAATTTDTGPWALTVFAPKQATTSSVSCRVDLIYTGWNANASWGHGYKDVEHVPLTFYVMATSTVVETEGLVAGTSTTAVPVVQSVSSVDSDATSTEATSTSSSEGTLSEPPTDNASSTVDAVSEATSTPAVSAADTSSSDASSTPEQQPPSQAPPPESTSTVQTSQ
jgi:hypothetical protein